MLVLALFHENVAVAHMSCDLDCVCWLQPNPSLFFPPSPPSTFPFFISVRDCCSAAQIVSSGYDRTLESATALAFGLYPIGQSDAAVEGNTLLWDNQIVVPIHSSNPENDGEFFFFF